MAAEFGSEGPSGARNGGASFDLVVLDLEGTLVTGRRPDRAVWQALVPAEDRERWARGLRAWDGSGSPAARAPEFVDGLQLEQRARWSSRFEAECAALAEHRGLWRMPRVPAVLSELREAGARLAIATYAGPGAVDIALVELGLGEHVEGRRCLDGRGPDDKAEMLAELCVEFGTRSAILVGDSRSDADAALRAGLPFIALAPDQFAPVGRGSAAGGASPLGSWAELPDALAARRRGAERLLADRPEGTRRVVLDGAPLAGAGLLARDLARWAPEGVEVLRERAPWGRAEGPSGTWRLLVEVPREVAVERRAGGAHFGAEGALEFEGRWERWETEREAARSWSDRRLSGEDPLRPAARAV